MKPGKGALSDLFAVSRETVFANQARANWQATALTAGIITNTLGPRSIRNPGILQIIPYMGGPIVQTDGKNKIIRGSL